MGDVSVSGQYPVINSDGAYNDNSQFDFCEYISTFLIAFCIYWDELNDKVVTLFSNVTLDTLFP